MRFLVDECTGPKVAAWLRAEGHEVFSVFDEARGVEDDQVIQKGNRNGQPRWFDISRKREILITSTPLIIPANLLRGISSTSTECRVPSFLEVAVVSIGIPFKVFPTAPR